MADSVTALEWLGLPPDADSRAVKRAYAQRLKQVRPDVDPQGFQFLHTVYQMALQQCLMRDATLSAQSAAAEHGESSNDESGDTIQPGQTEPAAPVADHAACVQSDHAVADTQTEAKPVFAPAPPAAEAFNFATFYAELLRVAAPGDSDAVSSWLLQQPALWSLYAKAQVGARLIHALHQETPPLHEKVFDVLLGFFDLHHLRSGLDPLAMQDLQRRLQLRWDFEPGDFDERARRLRERHRFLYTSQDTLATLLQRLSRPLSKWRLLAMAAWPDTVDMYGRSPSSIRRDGWLLIRFAV